MYCKAFFMKKIILDKERFRFTAKTLEECPMGNLEDSLASPLVWKVESNKIESSYLRWIASAPRGKYVITWPWDNVRFSAILSTEYLLNNPEKKVVIITGRENEKEVPQHAEIFNHLFIKEGGPSPDFSFDIKKEMRQFNKNLILKKNDFVKYTVKKVNSDDKEEDSGTRLGTMEECLSFLRREYKNSIRSITRHPVPKYEKKKPKINKNGDVEVYLWYRPNQYFLDSDLLQDKRLSRDINYKSEWLWDYLINKDKYKRLKNIIPLTTPILENDNCRDSSGLYIIPQSWDIDDVKKIVGYISPDLLIVEDSDHYHRNRYFKSGGGYINYKKFAEMINGLQNSIILMFSCDPEARNCYNFYSNFKDYYSFTPHTWDSPVLTEELKNNPDDKIFYTLGSSGRVPFKSKPEIKVEYEIVGELDRITEFENECKRVLKNDPNSRSIFDYFKRIKKCTLDICGDTREVTTLKTPETNFDLLLSRIHKNTTEDDYKKICFGVKNVYIDSKGNPRNPLREKIEGIIKNILYNKYTYVTLAIDARDVKGAKILFGQYENSGRFTVCSWKNLEKTRNQIPKDYTHHIISTFAHYEHKFSKERDPRNTFHFVGERLEIEKIKNIIFIRTDESRIFPILPIGEKEKAPDLLHNIAVNFASMETKEYPDSFSCQEENELLAEEEYSGDEIGYFLERKMGQSYDNIETEEKSENIKNNEEPFIKESKNILSNARYNYKDNETERHKAIVRAIIDCRGEKKVLQALQYKSNIWGEKNYDLDNACNEDITWIKNNWDTGINIKEKLTKKGIKLKEELFHKN